ncbi:MAG: CDP-alcohol phosphatidyltransferase family protein [Clostridia bacterium]|nr:CDP-alcohol phosphatidyltransferase family protein [Clostridia bacterium]
MMARHVPNMLSVLRIFLSFLLIALTPVSAGFVVVYITIGITDVLDGFIARKFGFESDLGARLDSVADLVFYLILVFLFLKVFSPILQATHKTALIAIISIRFLNMLLTKLKYKRIVFLHTIANKLSGFLIFLIPIVLLFEQSGIVVWIILSIVFIAAIEELLMTVHYAQPDLNRKSILLK